MVSPKVNEEQPKLARESHLDITRNMLECMDKKTQMIFLSTDKVFDGTDACPNEESAATPQGLYGQLKLECERMIRAALPRHHILRMPIVHAAGNEISPSFVDKAIINMKTGQNVEALNNVERCFVKLEQLIALFRLLISSEKYGLYHIGSKMMNYYERIRQVCEENNLSWQDKLVAKAGQASPMKQNLDTTKLKEALNFSLN